MDLAYTQEQEAFRESIRQFVADRVPAERLTEIADGPEGWDPGLWKEAVELGLAGVGVPEERGGAGMGLVEEAIVAEELGRAVFPGPWLGSVVLSQPLLMEAPDLLEAVVRGDRIATVVGLDRYVVDVPAADLLLLAGKEGVLAVDKDETEWRVLPTVDGTRRLAEVTLPDDLPAPLADAEISVASMDRIRTRALAALAAEAVGVASRALELTVDYATEREQFGKKIGQYQAVSHQLADALMDIELARSLAIWAVAAIDAEDEDAGVAAATAKAFASDAAVRACERAIQSHGGIGFTWEHVLHRYYKRALWISAFLAMPSALRREVAARLLT